MMLGHEDSAKTQVSNKAEAGSTAGFIKAYTKVRLFFLCISIRFIFTALRRDIFAKAHCQVLCPAAALELVCPAVYGYFGTVFASHILKYTSHFE
jgi:hypothetical protein